MHAFERPDLRRLRCLCIRQAQRFTIANGPLMACLPSLSFRHPGPAANSAQRPTIVQACSGHLLVAGLNDLAS